MKSTIFTRIVDEGTIEVNDTLPGTIDKFRKMQGYCRETDSHDNGIGFQCNKKGKFWVGNIPTHSVYADNGDSRTRVRGQVMTENGKTVVKIYTVYQSHTKTAALICNVLIGLLLCILFVILNVAFLSIVVIPLCLLSFLYEIYYIDKYKTYIDDDANILKNEVLNRIEAIHHWDE